MALLRDDARFKAEEEEEKRRKAAAAAAAAKKLGVGAGAKASFPAATATPVAQTAPTSTVSRRQQATQRAQVATNPLTVVPFTAPAQRGPTRNDFQVRAQGALQTAKDRAAAGVMDDTQEYYYLVRQLDQEQFDQRLQAIDYLYRSYLTPYEGSGVVWDMMRSSYTPNELEEMLSKAYPKVFGGLLDPTLATPWLQLNGVDPTDPRQVARATLRQAITGKLIESDMTHPQVVQPLIMVGKNGVPRIQGVGVGLKGEFAAEDTAAKIAELQKSLKVAIDTGAGGSAMNLEQEIAKLRAKTDVSEVAVAQDALVADQFRAMGWPTSADIAEEEKWSQAESGKVKVTGNPASWFKWMFAAPQAGQFTERDYRSQLLANWDAAKAGTLGVTDPWAQYLAKLTPQLEAEGKSQQEIDDAIGATREKADTGDLDTIAMIFGWPSSGEWDSPVAQKVMAGAESGARIAATLASMPLTAGAGGAIRAVSTAGSAIKGAGAAGNLLGSTMKAGALAANVGRALPAFSGLNALIQSQQGPSLDDLLANEKTLKTFEAPDAAAKAYVEQTAPGAVQPMTSAGPVAQTVPSILTNDPAYQQFLKVDAWCSDTTNSADTKQMQLDLQALNFGTDLEANGIWTQDWRRVVSATYGQQRRDNVQFQFTLQQLGYADQGWTTDGNMQTPDWQLAQANFEEAKAKAEDYQSRHPKAALFLNALGWPIGRKAWDAAFSSMWSHGVLHGIVSAPLFGAKKIGDGLMAITAAIDLEMRQDNDPAYQQAHAALVQYVEDHPASPEMLADTVWPVAPPVEGQYVTENSADKAFLEWAFTNGYLAKDETAQRLYTAYKGATTNLLNPALYKGDLVSLIGNAVKVDQQELVEWEAAHPDAVMGTNILLNVGLGLGLPKVWKATRNVVGTAREVSRTVEGITNGYSSIVYAAERSRAWKLFDARNWGGAARRVAGKDAGPTLEPLLKQMGGDRSLWTDDPAMNAKAVEVSEALASQTPEAAVAQALGRASEKDVKQFIRGTKDKPPTQAEIDAIREGVISQAAHGLNDFDAAELARVKDAAETAARETNAARDRPLAGGSLNSVVGKAGRDAELQYLAHTSADAAALVTPEGWQLYQVKQKLIELQVNRGKVFGGQHVTEETFNARVDEQWLAGADIFPHLTNPVDVKPVSMAVIALDHARAATHSPLMAAFMGAVNKVMPSFRIAPMSEISMDAVRAPDMVANSALAVSGGNARFAELMRTRAYLAGKDKSAWARIERDLAMEANKNFILQMGKGNRITEALNRAVNETTRGFGNKGESASPAMAPAQAEVATTVGTNTVTVKPGENLASFTTAEKRASQVVPDTAYQSTVIKGYRETLFAPLRVTSDMNWVVEGLAHLRNAGRKLNKEANAISVPLRQYSVAAGAFVLFQKHLVDDSMRTVISQGFLPLILRHKYHVEVDAIFEKLSPAVRDEMVTSRFMSKQGDYMYTMGRRGQDWTIAKVFQDDPGALPADIIRHTNNKRITEGAEALRRVTMGDGMQAWAEGLNMPGAGVPIPAGYTRLYRVTSTSGKKPMAGWLEESPEFQNTQAATGRFFTDELSTLDFYKSDMGAAHKLEYVDVPLAEVEAMRVRNIPMKQTEGASPQSISDNPRAFSRDPDTEFYIPKAIAHEAKMWKEGQNYIAGQAAVRAWLETPGGKAFLKDGNWYAKVESEKALRAGDGDAAFQAMPSHDVAVEQYISTVVEDCWEQWNGALPETMKTIRETALNKKPINTAMLEEAIKANYLKGENPYLSLPPDIPALWQRALDPGTVVGWAMKPNKMNRGAVYDSLFAKTYERLTGEGVAADAAARASATVADMGTARVHFDLSRALNIEVKYRSIAWFATKHRLYTTYLLKMAATHPTIAVAAIEVADWFKQRSAEQGNDDYGSTKFHFSIFGYEAAISIAPIFWLTAYAEESGPAQWAKKGAIELMNTVARKQVMNPANLAGSEFDITFTRVQPFIKTVAMLVHSQSAIMDKAGTSEENLEDYLNTLSQGDRETWYKGIHMQMAYAAYKGEDISITEAFNRAGAMGLASEAWKAFKVVPMDFKTGESSAINKLVETYYGLKTPDERAAFIDENPALQWALGIYTDPIKEFHVNEGFDIIDEASKTAQVKLAAAVNNRTIMDPGVIKNILDEYENVWGGLTKQRGDGNFNEDFAAFVDATVPDEFVQRLGALFPLIDADQAFQAGRVPDAEEQALIDDKYVEVLKTKLAERGLVYQNGTDEALPIYRVIRSEVQKAKEEELKRQGYDLSYQEQTVVDFLNKGGDAGTVQADLFMELVHNGDYRALLQRGTSGTTGSGIVKNRPWLLGMTPEEKLKLGINYDPRTEEQVEALWRQWAEQYQVIYDYEKSNAIKANTKQWKVDWAGFQQFSESLAAQNPAWANEYGLSQMPLYARLEMVGVGSPENKVGQVAKAEAAGWGEFLPLMGTLRSAMKEVELDNGQVGVKTLTGTSPQTKQLSDDYLQRVAALSKKYPEWWKVFTRSFTLSDFGFYWWPEDMELRSLFPSDSMPDMNPDEPVSWAEEE